MVNSTKQYAGDVQHAVDTANDVTPSVIALARASGLTAKKFAEAINEAEANSLYRIELSSVLQGLLVKSAVVEAKKRKEAGLSDIV